jgi:hypothetical protein
MKHNRQLVITNDVLVVGKTVRRDGHLWNVLSVTSRPGETEKYEYLLERAHRNE